MPLRLFRGLDVLQAHALTSVVSTGASVLVVGPLGSGGRTLLDILLAHVPVPPAILKAPGFYDRPAQPHVGVTIATAATLEAPLVVLAPRRLETTALVNARLSGRQALVLLQGPDLSTALAHWSAWRRPALGEPVALGDLFDLAVVLDPFGPTQLLVPATQEPWPGAEDLLARNLPDPAHREAFTTLAPNFNGTFEELVAVASSL